MFQISDEIKKFLVVGGTTVFIDFFAYNILLFFGVDFTIAKAISFLVGTVFAYFANRKWTFSYTGSHGKFYLFMIVYSANLVINVSSNDFVLWLLGSSPLAVLFAFLVATGISATLNFLGMKYLVFRDKGDLA